MTENAKPPAPAGWYSDKLMPGTRRYWDGKAWTDHVAPEAPPQPKASGIRTLAIARGVAIGLAAVIGGVWFINSLVTGDDELDCAVESANRAVAGLPEQEC